MSINKHIKIDIDHPMLQEKNFLMFRYEGLICVVVRMAWSGTLNGYVAVGEEHPYYRKHYDELMHIDIHGGLTYSDSFLANIDKDMFGDLWWFGFDTNHLHDQQPFEYFSLERDGTYKDIDYVVEQTKQLAEQLSQKPNIE